MSGALEQRWKRRTSKMYLVSTCMKVDDQLDGFVQLRRGFICQELEPDKYREDCLWVKVIDNEYMVKMEKRFLIELSSDYGGLLEPVSDPKTRLNLLYNSEKLEQLASLPTDSLVWVQIGKQDELAEAQLKFIGPLNRLSNPIYFGVELKGSAVGKGVSNGSFKGRQYFTCPAACALFLPVSHIHLCPSNGTDKHERDHHRCNSNNHPVDGHHSNSDRMNQQQQQHPRPINAQQNPRPVNAQQNPRPVNAQQNPRPINAQQNPRPINAQQNSRPINAQQNPRPINAQQHPRPITAQQHPRPITAQQHPRPINAHHCCSCHPQPLSFIPRTTELTPASAPNEKQNPTTPPPYVVGQRVCFPGDKLENGGEVRFCGPLPGLSGMYVGVILDCPVGKWNGYYEGEKLCYIPSPFYGALLPVTKVCPEPNYHHNPPHKVPKSIRKPAPPPATKPVPVTPPIVKVALMPPTKQPVKPPALPPLKPAQKPHPVPPLPPPKPQSPTSPTTTEQHTDGARGPPSLLRSPVGSESERENEEESVDGKLEVGSMVEVNDPPLFGVIRWIGRISGISDSVAGIELDQELSAGTDGSYLGERHFRCPANKGLFVKLRNCRRDSRFPAPETPLNQVERCNSIAFAEWGSERVEEHTPPVGGDEARELYQGWKRGIQGHLNSCYLDATLFSLFSCCTSADWVLFWTDPDQSSNQAQDLLRCEIVNPLRRFGYVCASKTMALRRLLEAANSDTGFTNQEKDPEEFLNKLFQLLRVEPLLKIRSMTQKPQECHLYQLFPPTLPPSPSSPLPLSPVDSSISLSLPPSNHMRVASVQALLESSFLHSGLKFVEAPSCLLLLMPRFGKDFKMFDAIMPTLSLDITDLLDDTLRQCSICQAVAEWECFQCYEDPDITPGHLKQYCHTCNTQVHNHSKRESHSPVEVGVPGGEWTGPLEGTRQRMSLFAVTCIETSHYVSFVKHGPLPTDWLFFDSMADREGGENGFNIPQVKACPEVGRYLSLSEEALSRVDPSSLQEPARRLLCDAYMCLYHSPELSLYK